MIGITPSQTVGPYYAYCLTPTKYTLHQIFSNDLIVPGLEGEKIRIEGRVLDGDNIGISDAMVEIWQADAKGGFAHARDHEGSNIGFKGFGRVEPDDDGKYHFVTIKPGRVKTPDGKLQAPHIDVAVFARGMLKHLVTRIYFAEEESNQDDPVLQLVPADRRDTLIATPQGSGSGGEKVYRFDIRIQEGTEGPPETQFLEF
jgi:protocatechuate 3,4-dioxygenase, alpha subunit